MLPPQFGRSVPQALRPARAKPAGVARAKSVDNEGLRCYLPRRSGRPAEHSRKLARDPTLGGLPSFPRLGRPMRSVMLATPGGKTRWRHTPIALRLQRSDMGIYLGLKPSDGSNADRDRTRELAPAHFVVDLSGGVAGFIGYRRPTEQPFVHVMHPFDAGVLSPEHGTSE